MGALERFVEKLNPSRKAALAAVGILAVLVSARPADADQFGGRAFLPVDSVRVARAFDDRASEHLEDLVELARGLLRIDMGPRRDMSGAEQARKIQFAYLYEYANAPHKDLKRFDRFFLEADRRAPEGRTIDAIADLVNAKKELLIRGTTLVDEMAAALKREDYPRAERIAYRINEIMDNEAAPLLRRGVDPYDGVAGWNDGSDERNPSLKEQAAGAILGLLSR